MSRVHNEISHFCLRKQYHILKDELLRATDAALKEGMFVDGKFTQQLENWLMTKMNSKLLTSMAML